MKPIFAAVIVIAGALALLRPWTIVPIETKNARTFDPAGYAASVWESRVLPAAEKTAVDLRTFLQEPMGATRRAVFVKGTFKVIDVDRTSRVGLARLELPLAQDGRRAAIQIGPVLRGTAVRDALDFIRFTDFVNQLDFASVASALNDRVVAGVLASAADIVPGVQLTFIGAVAVPSGTARDLEIVPVTLNVEKGRR
jgi:predicted lipoprotein